MQIGSRDSQTERQMGGQTDRQTNMTDDTPIHSHKTMCARLNALLKIMIVGSDALTT